MNEAVGTVHCIDPATAEVGPHTAKPTALTADVTEAVAALWADAGQGIDVGIWECTPGTFTARRDDYTEVCVLLSGRVTLEVDGQDPLTLSAGDYFVTPRGWVGTWHVHETVRKVYVIVADRLA